MQANVVDELADIGEGGQDRLLGLGRQVPHQLDGQGGKVSNSVPGNPPYADRSDRPVRDAAAGAGGSAGRCS
jgi:hypothetical protein